MITKNIESVGLEIECGIEETLKASLAKKYANCALGGDGSVAVARHPKSNVTVPWDPYSEIKFHSDDKKVLKQFVKDIFEPNAMQQNSTCGNHVHMRFKDMNKAQALFSQKHVQNLFLRKYSEMASRRKEVKYRNRLSNNFCVGMYSRSAVIEQIRNPCKTSARYRAINLNSVNLHNTIEFRILPYCVDAKEYISNLKWIVKTADKLMSAHFSVSGRVYAPEQEAEIPDFDVDMTNDIENITVERIDLNV